MENRKKIKENKRNHKQNEYDAERQAVSGLPVFFLPLLKRNAPEQTWK